MCIKITPWVARADLCASEYKITREEQDQFAIQSYTRSAEAWAAGRFNDEVIPVSVPQKKGDALEFRKDESYTQVNFDKIPSLKPAFEKNGTVTAANASGMNDGAAAVVLMSKKLALQKGIKPLAVIRGYADAEQAPEWFTTTPSIAVPKAVEKSRLSMEEIDFFELNEAFSVVGIVNSRLMNLDATKVNVNGGSVSLWASARLQRRQDFGDINPCAETTEGKIRRCRNLQWGRRRFGAGH